jgi:DNA-binding HxlR family transcriptional regulator
LKAKKDKNIQFRSSCPISSTLDLIGDKWSLLILRDLCFVGKRTFSEFSNSEEHIAANILADRLKKLESSGLIDKGKSPENKKTVIYSVTPKGVDMIPLLVEYILWADKYLGDTISPEAKSFAAALRDNKEKLIHQISTGLKNP